jgi:site-specific DNA recombinase
MIAAIYARKSTEQNGVADDAKSVARQIEHGRAYAERKGWHMAAEHIYSDDGISGAEFVKRPGFLRLMNALKPRPPFRVLIMSEESRLGREQIETAYALKQIVDAGVRVFFYLEDRERTLDSAMDKVMLSLTNFASEMERERARQRTYDAMVRKAKALQVTGGKVYGYDNIDVLSPETGKRVHVVRKVNAEQAEVVRRIFEMYAGGLGFKRIADTLNKEHVASPRGGRGWAVSGVREMLHRELYRGVLVWNRTQKVVRGGTKKQRRRATDDWVRVEAPDQRIVSDELWQRAHTRLEKARELMPRSFHGGRSLGRPSYLDGDSPYLLTGFAKCAICGGAIGSIPRAHGVGEDRQRVDYYGCFTNHRRGTAICANKMHIRQELLDRAVLAGINHVLDERMLELAVDKELARLRSGQMAQLNRHAQITRELSLIEAREYRLVEAIKRGDAVEPLVAALKVEGEQKKALTRELETLGAVEKVASLDAHQIKRELQTRVADVRALLGRRKPQARQMLRKLLRRIDMTPAVENGQRGYRLVADESFAKLFSGTVLEALPPTVVAPTGFAREANCLFRIPFELSALRPGR